VGKDLRRRPRLLLDTRPRARSVGLRAGPAGVLPGDPLGAPPRRRRRHAAAAMRHLDVDNADNSVYLRYLGWRWSDAPTDTAFPASLAGAASRLADIVHG